MEQRLRLENEGSRFAAPEFACASMNFSFRRRRNCELKRMKDSAINLTDIAEVKELEIRRGRKILSPDQEG